VIRQLLTSLRLLMSILAAVVGAFPLGHAQQILLLKTIQRSFEISAALFFPNIAPRRTFRDAKAAIKSLNGKEIDSNKVRVKYVDIPVKSKPENHQG
jgi:hypothetical protein